MPYEFFKAQEWDAVVGLAVDEERLAVHVPCQSGGRNPNLARRPLFEAVLRAVREAAPAAFVLGFLGGRSDNPVETVDTPLSESGATQLEEGFRASENFRFTFWLEGVAGSALDEVKQAVGLEGVEYNNLEAQWPEDLAAERDARSAESRAFLQALAEQLGAVDPSSTVGTKWNPVEAFLADAVGLEAREVVVGVASASNRVWNKLRQRNGQATLRVLLAPDVVTARSAEGALEDAVAGKASIDADVVMLVRRDADSWEPSHLFLVKRDGHRLAQRMAELTGLAVPMEVTEQANLAASLHLPEEWIADVLWLLEDKKGLVFYGPPGTGKTYLAQKIAEYLQPDAARRTLVQLHPSFGYEEFFEGYRPTEDAGEGVKLSKFPGPLLRLVGELTDGEQLGVLILDEMNRSNLPRVFGELYFLLEYRDRKVRLMYSPDQEFQLPDGLRIIGTMNTADRSVALLDQALRRRFHFKPLFPGESPVDEMLRRYLTTHYGDRFTWLADVLNVANSKLDRNVAIGPSHFMRRDLDEVTIDRIWRHSVLPTIEEHLFGEQERLPEFDLANLRQAVRADVRDSTD